MSDGTLILTASEVAELLPMRDCVAAVEEAFRAHGARELGTPGMLSIHEERGAIHIKTATLGGRFAAKINANFPSNPRDHGLPTIQGVIALFDATNGAVLALLDSIEVTVRRTAAATAVAAKYLAPRSIECRTSSPVCPRPQAALTGGGQAGELVLHRNAYTVTIAGCGKQGRVQLEALRGVLPVERVLAFDVVRERAEELGEVALSLEEAIAQSDVVVTCTTSKQPIVHALHDGVFVAAVGADNPEKSEIAPEAMRRAVVVADVLEQCATIGDLHHAIAAGVMSRDDVRAELGAIVAGRAEGRRSDREAIVFDSTGAGFQDAAAVAMLYDRAVASGRGTWIRLNR